MSVVGEFGVHQKSVSMENAGLQIQQGFYVIQWTYTYYMYKIISTFTTMRYNF